MSLADDDRKERDRLCAAFKVGDYVEQGHRGLVLAGRIQRLDKVRALAWIKLDAPPPRSVRKKSKGLWDGQLLEAMLFTLYKPPVLERLAKEAE